MNRYTKKDYFIIAGLILLCLVPAIAGTYRLITLGFGGEIRPENERFFHSPAPAVFHIVSSLVFGLLGAFQFSPGFRRKHLEWHRASGQFLVFFGLVSALSGLWLTLFYPHVPTDGDYLYSIRIAVGIAMTICVILGFTSIRKRQISNHSDWMIRAYAIGMGAGTQVLTHLPWFILVGEPTGLSRDLLMGAGWAVNILSAEWIIRRKKYLSAENR